VCRSGRSNCVGGPAAVEPQSPAGGWENDGALTLAAHSLHAEDGDFVQAGALYREVYDDAAKARLLETITGAVGGVKSPGIKERAIQYWTNVDAELGAKLRANLGAAPAGTSSDAEAANKIG
jgi:catalase